MTQSDANQSPWLNSLITRENTGNFNDFGRLGAELWPKKPCLLSGFRRNSLLNGTGNFETSTANYFAGTGNFLQITGKLHEVYPDKSQDLAGMQRFFKQFRRRARIQHIARVRDSLRPPESDHSRDGG